MNTKNLKLPILILAIGLVAVIVAYMLTSIVIKPTVTEAVFPFSVTYTLDGETKTLTNAYRCTYHPEGANENPRGRYYTGTLVDPDPAMHAYSYTIATKGTLSLCIVTYFNNSYLMNDTTDEYYDEYVEDPYFIVYDTDYVAYEDEETINQFNAEILSWEYPDPITNTFEFAGFSVLFEENTLAMLAVCLLLLGACAGLVKKDPDVHYGRTDELSFALNLLIGILGVPFLTIVSMLVQMFQTGPDFFYQSYLCAPIITLFSLSVSLVLRRKGYAKPGLFVQLVGPVFFTLMVLTETFFF